MDTNDLVTVLDKHHSDQTHKYLVSIRFKGKLLVTRNEYTAAQIFAIVKDLCKSPADLAYLEINGTNTSAQWRIWAACILFGIEP